MGPGRGADKEDDAGPLAEATPLTEAEALIKEARRRHRRRQLITGLAAAAVLLGAARVIVSVTAGSPPRPSPPRPVTTHAVPQVTRPLRPGPIPRSVDSTVLMWPFGSGPLVDNLQTGNLVVANRLTVDPNSSQTMLRVGRWIVYADYKQVWATSARWRASFGRLAAYAAANDLTGKPRLLGKAYLFAPSAAPGHVWLQDGFVTSGPNTVRSVDIADGQAGPPIALSQGTELVAGTDAGLLLSRRAFSVHSRLQLWDPGTTPVTLPHSSGARGVAISRQLVAYDTGCASENSNANGEYSVCQMMRVFDLVTGKLRSFAAPPGTGGWVPGQREDSWSVSAIASSGSMMAANAAIPPYSHGMVRVFVLRLAGRDLRSTPVPSSTAAFYAETSWSVRGSWLFYQGPGQQMWAYQVGTGNVRSSRTPCCQYIVMATLNGPSG